MKELKDNLKHLAKEHDVTMAKLARATGIAPQTLNNWLAGQEPRSLKQVKKVSDFFEITLDELCFGAAPQNKDTIESYSDEINAGVFEVVLRRVKK